jgi:MerR family transcriptional regulator, thiopeptide resistance regulator
VGELARRAGVSVRTLHHYEEIGLLAPSARTEAGHRLYAGAEVLRLQQIASLRSLGLSLGEIRACLDSGDYSPVRVVELHAARLRERIELERRLCERLEAVSALLNARKSASGEVVSAKELVETVMEVTRMSKDIEKYYTPEQLERLESRKQELGEMRIKEVEAEWPVLIERVRAEMEAGTDPADERVQGLARRWIELVEELTGGDPDILRSLNSVWRQEENIAGMDRAHARADGVRRQG